MSQGDEFLEDLGVKSIKKIEENESSGKKRKIKRKASHYSINGRASISRSESHSLSKVASVSGIDKSDLEKSNSKAKINRQDTKRSIVSVFFEWYSKHPKPENDLAPLLGANSPTGNQL